MTSEQGDRVPAPVKVTMITSANVLRTRCPAVSAGSQCLRPDDGHDAHRSAKAYWLREGLNPDADPW